MDWWKSGLVHVMGAKKTHWNIIWLAGFIQPDTRQRRWSWMKCCMQKNKSLSRRAMHARKLFLRPLQPSRRFSSIFYEFYIAGIGISWGFQRYKTRHEWSTNDVARIKFVQICIRLRNNFTCFVNECICENANRQRSFYIRDIHYDADQDLWYYDIMLTYGTVW